MKEILELFIENVVEYASIIIELVGLAIIVFGVLREIYSLIFLYKLDVKKAIKDTKLNISLSKALEILLAGEILQSIIGFEDLRRLIYIGLLVFIRIFITFVLHWELKNKEEEEK